MGGWSRPISSRWVVVVVLAWAVWTALQKQVSPASILLRQRWSSTLTVTHLSIGKRAWGETQRVDWRWHVVCNSKGFFCLFFLAFYGFIDRTARRDRTRGQSLCTWDSHSTNRGNVHLKVAPCCKLKFKLWSISWTGAGEIMCLCGCERYASLECFWRCNAAILIDILFWGTSVLFYTKIPLHMHRLFTPAFRGVRDNTGHSLAKQFPIATKPTCLICLECFILVLFISLYFYWTHMGICSVSLFV